MRSAIGRVSQNRQGSSRSSSRRFVTTRSIDVMLQAYRWSMTAHIARPEAVDDSAPTGHSARVLSRLVVGTRVRVSGTYVANWERSELRLFVIRPFPNQVRCALEDANGVAADVFKEAGVPVPPADAWRRHRGMSFAVVANVTPLEMGHFGHMHAQRWRLRVDDWIAVSPRA